MTKLENSSFTRDEAVPTLSQWLWRPWFAKLWWGTTIAYWSVKVVSLWVESLEVMNEPGVLGYFNILFYPPLVLAVLGTGWLRRRWEIGSKALEADASIEHLELPSVPPRYLNALDPASGPNWIGSTLNPQNPGYRSPFNAP